MAGAFFAFRDKKRAIGDASPPKRCFLCIIINKTIMGDVIFL